MPGPLIPTPRPRSFSPPASRSTPPTTSTPRFSPNTPSSGSPPTAKSRRWPARPASRAPSTAWAAQRAFNEPQGVGIDASGVLYVAEFGNSTIRKVAANGNVLTMTGLAGVRGRIDGPPALARFNQPRGLAVDRIGNVYVADSVNSAVRLITLDNHTQTIAGGTSGTRDAVGTIAQFMTPWGIAIDASGNVFVTDATAQTVRKIAAVTRLTTTIAGSTGAVGSADGTGSTARFNQPTGIACRCGGQPLSDRHPEPHHPPHRRRRARDDHRRPRRRSRRHRERRRRHRYVSRAVCDRRIEHRDTLRGRLPRHPPRRARARTGDLHPARRPRLARKHPREPYRRRLGCTRAHLSVAAERRRRFRSHFRDAAVCPAAPGARGRLHGRRHQFRRLRDEFRRDARGEFAAENHRRPASHAARRRWLGDPLRHGHQRRARDLPMAAQWRPPRRRHRRHAHNLHLTAATR
jgi:hypothetical protein